MDIIQHFIYCDVHLHRRSDHSAEQLCNVGGVAGVLERHHSFCPWAVPPSGKILLEKYYTDIPVLGDIRGFHIAHIQPAYRNCLLFTERMYNLSGIEPKTSTLLDFLQAVL